MNNISVDLDMLQLRDKLTTRVFGSIIANINPGTNERVNASALENMGVTYDYIRNMLDRRPRNILTPVLETAVSHIDYASEKFVLDHNCKFSTTEDRFEKGFSMEDAGEAAFEEEDGDITSGIIADMIEDLSKKHSTEIRDLAKYILKLEKEKQGEDKELAEQEDNDYVQEDDDVFGDQNEEGDGNTGEGDSENPFGDDQNSEEGEQESGENESSSDGDDGNPFGSDDGDSSSGDETTSSSDSENPFSSDSEGGETDNGESSSDSSENPFASGDDGESNSDDSSDDSSSGSDSNLNSDNPFESFMASVRKGNRYTNVFRAVGIESGDIVNYVFDTVGTEYKQELNSLFEEFGMESPQFKAKQKEVVKISEVAIESICASIATMFGLGLPLDMSRIKYYK